MRKSFLVLACAAGVVMGSVGCSWVELSPQAENVRVLTSAETAGCERIGSTTSNSMNKVGFIERNHKKIESELLILARNEAAKMGGNAIVPEAGMEEGRQSFIVYRCG